ncbi:hypothetical protein EN784_31960 [bacterium M00.F.Ca.ET.141.01.1.1]|uniref:hypothetical protein n=1 Tax=unclassified Mesorhizobium TaxID=325217 RepID=UPI000FD8C078|nr:MULTISPECIES: hypothetical protein [unclassified Mesorhizobium]TGR58296.1 hypothetical protein EN842_01500 [bacterium M00.F.Ca.ET.199.01.1.1]TGU41596.1 hypothetical protein EN799_03315 [bacterium M00.F.Ca.ET.156.01.1.1]TGV55086.1 hypothetical protein EN784_31960 [bacterium M00.F.Ca.ET.141.01.1.1]TGV89780.1 hypothetical protein EN792_006370 [Mesorhizobium sp. M00.F.Ca.ET.149.01.1.1]TGR33038.1 hypothetical protein EN840_01500 [Mesorhizobium sp. M8A.F.Ca.ET.197.01.1.1]
MDSAMGSFAWACALFASATISAAAHADEPAPSRPPIDKCVWEKMTDRRVGLAAWVQRCDFGFRQIHFEFVGNALAIKYSDGGAADPLVEVFDIKSGETAEAAVLRLLLEKTDKAVSARCVLASYTEGTVPAGVKRYTFSPDSAYAKELQAKANDEVPEPPCGDWGEMPDGIQYFEVPAGEGRKVLFMRVGQDEPLFDEQTLRVLP